MLVISFLKEVRKGGGPIRFPPPGTPRWELLGGITMLRGDQAERLPLWPMFHYQLKPHLFSLVKHIQAPPTYWRG